MSDEKPVSFRLSPALRDLVEEQAEEHGVSFSEMVRRYCWDGVDGDGREDKTLSAAIADGVESDEDTAQTQTQQ